MKPIDYIDGQVRTMQRFATSLIALVVGCSLASGQAFSEEPAPEKV
jgi:hypothetical protein